MADENRAQAIARVMASMGFQPTHHVDARYVEYYKDYAEPHGRVARCTVLFNKGGVIGGLDHAKLERFVITVQGVVEPVLDEVTAKAPRVMHDDMLQALRALEGISHAEPQAVETVQCNVCARNTAEWVIGKSGNPVCPRCMKVAINDGQG